MSKKMLVNATHPEENRVAIVMDGILTELDVEVSGREPTKGNIYKAVVVRVESGLQAAFVDYGAERLGFLQIDEVNAKTVKPDFKQADNKGRPRITDLLHRGQEILVQITKEERGTKGAALTTYLSLAGRFMVCMPDSQTRGVSRKVESDAERKQLKKAMAALDLPDNIGYIVRTAGLGKSQEELQRDFNYLMRLYEGIRDLGKTAKAPSLVYKESNLVIRSIRDYFTTEMDEVLIDDPDVFNEAREFFQRVMPEHAGLVKLHQERRPIFSRYQIEEQIETINQNKVQLPSGGSIVIDSTEALVAVDVNSGKMTSEQGVEGTAFKVNIEAAEEIGRQLRLRDLGGLIVIDFIDMRDRKHAREVENTLKKSLENDKARVSIGRISSKFGLLEMSRQRIKSALTEGTLLSCPHCQGSGRVKSPESLAVGLMRRIHAGVAKGQIGRVDAQLPLDVASYLLNDKREELYEMERRHNLHIHIQGRPDILTDQIEIEFQKREKEKPAPPEYVEAGTLLLQPESQPEEPKAEQESPAETEEKPKKRRRRRRRKPAADKSESEAAQTNAAGNSQPPDSEQPEGAEQSTRTQPEVVEPSGIKTDDAAAEVAAKPKRRRSPRKKKTPQPPAAETSTVTDPGPAAPASEPAEPAEAAPAATEAKPKRRRSPRRKPEAEKTASTEPAPDPAASQGLEADNSQAATQAPPEPTVKNETATVEAEVKPKPRRHSRRRTSASRPAAQTVPVETPPTAHSTAGPEPASAETAIEQPAPKPKRRRPPRKKAEEQAAGPAPGAEQASSPEVAAKESSESGPPEAGEEKPKKPARRRAPRKKPAESSPATT